MMSLKRHRAAAFAMSMLLVAGILGASLGVAMAGSRGNLSTGFNLIGGPLSADVTPNEFVSCLPSDSWEAVYIWNASKQEWKHYFNATGSVPKYINDTKVGGIDKIPQLSGVVIIMKKSVSSAVVPEGPGQGCS
jgi:hypothetical protein